MKVKPSHTEVEEKWQGDRGKFFFRNHFTVVVNTKG